MYISVDVTYITISSNNGLLPVRRQANVGTHADIWSIEQILVLLESKYSNFHSKKMKSHV